MQDEIDLFDWMDSIENDGQEVISVRSEDTRWQLSEGDSVAVEYGDAFTSQTDVLIGEVTDVTEDAFDGRVVTLVADGEKYVVRKQKVRKHGESGAYKLKAFYAAEDSEETLIADGGRNGPHPTVNVETGESNAESDTTDYASHGDAGSEGSLHDVNHDGPHPTVSVPTSRDELAELLEGRTATRDGGNELVAETCEKCGANVMVHAWHSAAGVHALSCPLCSHTEEAQ